MNQATDGGCRGRPSDHSPTRRPEAPERTKHTPHLRACKEEPGKLHRTSLGTTHPRAITTKGH
eukprot:15436566-Alexandrium_andersonii.AAC.1